MCQRRGLKVLYVCGCLHARACCVCVFVRASTRVCVRVHFTCSLCKCVGTCAKYCFFRLVLSILLGSKSLLPPPPPLTPPSPPTTTPPPPHPSAHLTFTSLPPISFPIISSLKCAVLGERRNLCFQSPAAHVSNQTIENRQRSLINRSPSLFLSRCFWHSLGDATCQVVVGFGS